VASAVKPGRAEAESTYMPRIRRALPLFALTLALAAPTAAEASITEYTSGLSAGSAPENIVTGPDGALWFTQPGGGGSIGAWTP